MSLTQTNLEELANHYDHTDTADDMGGGEWVNEPAIEPMVTTSLRLPADLMEAIRAQAAAQRVRPTALMRQWVEVGAKGRAGGSPQVGDELLNDLRDVVVEIRQIIRPAGTVGKRKGTERFTSKTTTRRRPSTAAAKTTEAPTTIAATAAKTTKTSTTSKTSTTKKSPAKSAAAKRTGRATRT